MLILVGTGTAASSGQLGSGVLAGYCDGIGAMTKQRRARTTAQTGFNLSPAFRTFRVGLAMRLPRREIHGAQTLE